MKNLNVNVDFLLDIWAELKAKRLAPVAIGLVVALVAVPALLMKGEEAPTDGPLPIAAPTAANGAEVEVAEELAEGGSKLDSYKSRDPFDGLVKPEKDGAAADGSATVPADALGGAKEPAPSAPAGGSGGSAGGGGGGLDLGDSTGSGGTPDLGSGSPNAGAPAPPKVVRKPRARFNYHLDLKFGRPGREKRYRSLPRMSLLPSARVPALLFMGVAADEKSAMFFVHPGLNHQGQGECIPSRTNCTYLRMEIGDQHYVSANDFEFSLRLLDVKRVKLSKEKKQRAAARKASGQRRSSRTTGTSPEAGAAEEQALPWLVDGLG